MLTVLLALQLIAGAEVSTYIRGMARIDDYQGNIYYGAGMDQTLRWPGGREVIYLSITGVEFSHPDDTYRGRICFMATERGTEIAWIPQVGLLELLPADESERELFRQNANQCECNVRSITIYREGDAIKFWIERVR